MFYYINVLNNKIIGVTQCKIMAENLKQFEVTKEIFENYEKYTFKDDKIVLIENYDELKAKEQRKEEILYELETIDLKSIRALRAGETEKLEELEKQAIELRKELGEL